VNLAAIPSPTNAVWDLGPLPIRAYALCIVLGILAACLVTEVRMRRRGAPQYLVLDIAVWAVPLGIIGARIYHVITSPDDYFGSGGHPLDALKIWHGGLGIWGAVAGGAVGAWIACRLRGIPLSFVADALAPGLPLAQGIGRWGNWFNNELYGGHTSLPWGLQVHVMDNSTQTAILGPDGKAQLVPGGPFHPTFLYESLWCVGVAILCVWADRRFKLGYGRVFAVYVAAYTVGRFWIESLRTDPAHHILGMRLNDWTAIIVFIGAVAYFFLSQRSHPGRETSPYLPGFESIGENAPEPEKLDSDSDSESDPESDPDGATSEAVESGTGEPVAGEAAPADAGESEETEHAEPAEPDDGGEEIVPVKAGAKTTSTEPESSS